MVIPTTLIATVLLTSTSVTVKVPAALKGALVSLRLAASVSVPTVLMMGLSSVPVMVIAMVLLS